MKYLFQNFIGYCDKDKSPLLLADPCDAVPHAHRVVHRLRQSV